MDNLGAWMLVAAIVSVFWLAIHTTPSAPHQCQVRGGTKVRLHAGGWVCIKPDAIETFK